MPLFELFRHEPNVLGLFLVEDEDAIPGIDDYYIIKPDHGDNPLAAYRKAPRGADGNNVPPRHVPLVLTPEILVERLPAPDVAPGKAHGNDGRVRRVLQDQLVYGARLDGAVKIRRGGFSDGQ